MFRISTYCCLHSFCSGPTFLDSRVSIFLTIMINDDGIFLFQVNNKMTCFVFRATTLPSDPDFHVVFDTSGVSAFVRGTTARRRKRETLVN